MSLGHVSKLDQFWQILTVSVLLIPTPLRIENKSHQLGHPFLHVFPHCNPVQESPPKKMLNFLLNIQTPYWPPQLPFSLYFCHVLVPSSLFSLFWKALVATYPDLAEYYPFLEWFHTSLSKTPMELSGVLWIALASALTQNWLISGILQPPPPSYLNSVTCWITHTAGLGVITFIHCLSFSQISSHFFTLFLIPTCQLHPCCKRCLASVHPFQIWESEAFF